MPRRHCNPHISPQLQTHGLRHFGKSLSLPGIKPILRVDLAGGALPGIQIGQLLVQQGVLSEKQVQHILTVQRSSHRPFGDLAERLYGVSPEAVEDAWVYQYVQMAGVVDLAELEMDKQCLRVINRRQAWQFQILPTHHDDQHLNIATDAEHLIRAVNFSTRRLDEPVYFVIAQRKQLREFLMKHYPVPEHMAAFAENM
jgi:hypothetical protein